MALFYVQKPFNATGELLKSGSLVDDSGWLPRRSKTLCEQRYLRPCTHEEMLKIESTQSVGATFAGTPEIEQQTRRQRARGGA